VAEGARLDVPVLRDGGLPLGVVAGVAVCVLNSLETGADTSASSSRGSRIGLDALPLTGRKQTAQVRPPSIPSPLRAPRLEPRHRRRNDSGTPGRTRTCDPRLRRHADLGKNIEQSGGRDGVVTAIVGALSSAAAREPQALSRCVEALGLALGALMESAGDDVTGADDNRHALPDERMP
jgi:hypothetical protein